VNAAERLADTDAEPDFGGKYRILLELGEGGTATVHLAVARGPSGFNKLVVLKVPKAVIAADPSVSAMFLTEARLSARLNHRNIVQTNEIAEDGGRPVIVMEYLEGKPLSEIVTRARDRLPLWTHLRILADALGGLQYAHDATDFDGVSLNVVHRDMTPHNVFVTYDGQVKILDFGIAKLERSRDKTDTGIVKGKLRYMPPEQISGEEVDRRTDIYAVGIMLWEAAAGRQIFEGERERVIMNRVLNGELPKPSDVKGDVDPELERITMKALEAEPNDRYATASELQADLEALLEKNGARITHREIGALLSEEFAQDRTDIRRVVEARLSKVAAQSWENGFDQTTTGTRRRQTRRLPGALLAGALVLLVAVVAFWQLNRRSVNEKAAASANVPSPPASAPEPIQSAEPAALPAPTAAATVEPVEAVESVMLTLDITPAQSKVFLDDVAVKDKAPYQFPVPKDGKPHTIRVEAKGYAPASKSMTFDKALELRFALTPSRGTSPTPPTASAKAPTPDCNPPYTFNEKGFKIYKPQCVH
jgi:eukaryotic-like serine/threonine-protein kinase